MTQRTLDHPDGLPIGDGWLPAPSTAEVRFPYDGSVVATAPVGDEALAHRALDEALAVRDEVGRLPSHVRRRALQAAHDTVERHRDDLERLLVAETGKPLVDCRVEVARTLLTLQTAAEEVARLHGETVPLDLLPSGEGLLGFWVRKPIGVVVGIAGFNYPVLLATHKIAPAIAAGCPVVVKPAPQTPLSTIWLVHVVREALHEAGAPRAALQLVTGGPDVGVALTTDRRVGAVSFTGSAAVGHRIARDAAPTKVLLELGSNAALVVAADADLDAAADAVVRGGYYASGQACISVQRVVVVDAVREAFLERLTSRMGEVVVGDPRDEATRVSALIDDGSTGRVLEWVQQAVDAGARLVSGGTREGTSIVPTVLLDVPDGVSAWDEEIFGPVIAVRSVPDLDTAFEVVNRSRYGLHASVFTASLATAFEAVDRIEAGGVIVNEVPGFRSDVMPYGGVKDSGTGREGPRFAIDELTVTRMAVIRPTTG
ncbi:aldehyde dehydrogenase family protein [Terracoccus luteus]|uniref:Acyl-CoA reductase-like NAD-dependent aldehyde dehydrogenase n=1 Tax=Terracoccus luteus TaxID=53356 RepID=A0A839PSD4_9MICO|nr:aldehyde dehydrogenase family protein [Terracoccus luteus]MBB2987188.1 acyl-CoA reductase-like NAD-dependent aldehyde dehydrogenase [Terracoccus luteus]MCP2172839.1 acyl-CoA reductase-like NAD-dependent aldehyde dehydrogenase [Terracoccus luteus]